MAEEARVKELTENIHKLSRKKLEFKAKETVKRNRSFKGILGPFLQGSDNVDWINNTRRDKRRPISPKQDRLTALR